MGKNFYIGDWHYGHANCIAFDNRPFRDLDEMNAELVARWNGRVTDGDTVYVLGDMFWKTDADAVLAQLKGRKILVEGNHDRLPEQVLKMRFDGSCSYLEVQDGSRHVVLSHYPILTFRNMLYGNVLLYAHVHAGWDWHIYESTKAQIEALYLKPIAAYNTGCMMPWMGYAPRTLDEIEEGYKAWKKASDEMGPTGRPEVDRMLTLSTAHVSEETAELLKKEPEDNTMQLAVYTKAGTPGSEGYGWYVYLPARSHKRVPDDLKRCMAFAEALGCRVLCLDADGPEEPALPLYEWGG